MKITGTLGIAMLLLLSLQACSGFPITIRNHAIPNAAHVIPAANPGNPHRRIRPPGPPPKIPPR